jgi:hypothetical protein
MGQLAASTGLLPKPSATRPHAVKKIMLVVWFRALSATTTDKESSISTSMYTVKNSAVWFNPKLHSREKNMMCLKFLSLHGSAKNDSEKFSSTSTSGTREST